MVLNNNPNLEGGNISLIDAMDPETPHILFMKPTAEPNVYRATLSGHVEFEGDWEKLTDHPLICIVR